MPDRIWTRLFGATRPPRLWAVPRPRNESARLRLECLENRTLPATLLGVTANTFAVLGGSTVTNTGPTTVVGNLGVSPGNAVTGFPPGIVSGGTIHATDAVAIQAQAEVATAYGLLAGLPTNANLTGQDLGGLTLTPGDYRFDTSAQLTGTLTLDGRERPQRPLRLPDRQHADDRQHLPRRVDQRGERRRGLLAGRQLRDARRRPPSSPATSSP